MCLILFQVFKIINLLFYLLLVNILWVSTIIIPFLQMEKLSHINFSKGRELLMSQQ